MESPDSIKTPEVQISEDTLEKLRSLLDGLGIQEVYYIDDYNKVDPFPIIVAYSKRLFDEEKKDELLKLFLGKLNLEIPGSDELSDQIIKIWGELSIDDQNLIAGSVLENTGFNKLDYSRSKKLQESFPKDRLKMITPDQWETTFKSLEEKYTTGGKVLLLFDQDLSNSDNDDFKSGRLKGQHLILNIKNSSIGENVYCALITHLISDTSKELIERDSILKELNDKLGKKDFFALTKERISNPDLFCDGIKKTLLNGYCEEIKDRSKNIINEAQEETLKKFVELDTYDFDHTILRSSYTEGVWEANTLFRITGNIFNDTIKELMIKKNYSKEVNPFIKSAKTISDIRFEIDAGTAPYKEKYLLRHWEIYENGDIINKLHLPLENGDIFQILDGTGKDHFYILVAQECDLMMRTNRLGSRASNTGIFLRIKPHTRNELDEIIVRFFERDHITESHFFSNRFKLDYFNKETNDIGLVIFSDSCVVNLDVLDLCVFNDSGKATLDLSLTFDTDLVSTAWEHRYKKLFEKFKKLAEKLDKWVIEINKLSDKSIREEIKRKISINLAPIENLGKKETYHSNIFDFGIKRVGRLKVNGSTYLINRYHKYLSRTAEQHDFAVEEKIIATHLASKNEEKPSEPSPVINKKQGDLPNLKNSKAKS